MNRFLVTNDDGVDSPALVPLVEELSKGGEVFVVVPLSQMSGKGHSITLNTSKKVKKIKKNFFAVDGGTPADCIKYGLKTFSKVKFDMVISGINTCPNLGQDVIYSGTCGGAREGALNGILSLAVSAGEMHAREYGHSAFATRKIAEILLAKKNLFKGMCLNINIPKNYKGIKVVPLAISGSTSNVIVVVDKKGNFTYKLSGKYSAGGKNKNSDIDVLKQGFVAITPMCTDQTDFDLLRNG